MQKCQTAGLCRYVTPRCRIMVIIITIMVIVITIIMIVTSMTNWPPTSSYSSCNSRHQHHHYQHQQKTFSWWILRNTITTITTTIIKIIIQQKLSAAGHWRIPVPSEHWTKNQPVCLSPCIRSWNQITYIIIIHHTDPFICFFTVHVCAAFSPSSFLSAFLWWELATPIPVQMFCTLSQVYNSLCNSFHLTISLNSVETFHAAGFPIDCQPCQHAAGLPLDCQPYQHAAGFLLDCQPCQWWASAAVKRL